MLAALELGGTKIMCGIGDGQKLLSLIRFSTTDPAENFAEINEFLSNSSSQYGDIEAVGVAAFGPININPASSDYGRILNTPKPGWQNYSIYSALKQQFDVPVSISTDVNGALLAEARWGAAQGVKNCCYITVGTGVGAGIMVNGELVNGALHPEVGHSLVPNRLEQGHCQFHDSCVEGFVSGPAIAKRAGVAAESLPIDSPIWDDVAQTIAILCVNMMMTLSTERIILGGGVMHRSGLINKVRKHFMRGVNNYLDIDQLVGGVEQLITTPMLVDNSGLMGAMLLGDNAVKKRESDQ